MASEGRQRELAQELTDGVSGEYVLFSFPERHKGHIMKPAPCVWVDNLEKKITDTLEYNNRSARNTRLHVHMLEEHVLPFLRKWHVGFGFHGEQGAEALHRGFNRIKASYTSIPDALKRLMCVVREHHLQVSPVLVAQEPTKKKRRTL